MKRIQTRKTATAILLLLSTLLFLSTVYPMISTSDFLPTVENMSNLTASNYPSSDDHPILYKDYPVAFNPGVSDLGTEQMWPDYPVFPASSTINNNIRYWRSPDNGKCSPADMCGGLYDLKQDIKIPPPPAAPQWGIGTRVNYYDFQTVTCF